MTVNLDTALAAHRFGLGEADLAVVGPDPRAWLLQQIGPADAQVGANLATGMEALLEHREVVRKAQRTGNQAPNAAEVMQRAEARADMHPSHLSDKKKQSAKADKPGAMARMEAREASKDIAAQDVRARLLTAAQTKRPFAERIALFWINHFTVSQAAPRIRGLSGAFEREAIRPHIHGRFEYMLQASTVHPAMLRYLDNYRSVGPNSPAVLRAGKQPEAKQKNKPQGLNENLAREVLELHTLGAESSRVGHAGGYTQADVTEFARVLTGWTTVDDPASTSPVVFDPQLHDPGTKRVLGKVYPAGREALPQVLRDLSLHPATAHFLATKLARHFVADEPPPALVTRLAEAYLRSGGELAPMYRELVSGPEAWQPAAAKLRTPEEWALCCVRLLRGGDGWLGRMNDGDLQSMGQRVQWAPSPAGWSDRAEDWLGPDAVWKRIEWVTRLVQRLGSQADARQLARQALGPMLSAPTLQQIERAADGSQALTLLLMSPELQRR